MGRKEEEVRKEGQADKQWLHPDLGFPKVSWKSRLKLDFCTDELKTISAQFNLLDPRRFLEGTSGGIAKGVQEVAVPPGSKL